MVAVHFYCTRTFHTHAHTTSANHLTTTQYRNPLDRQSKTKRARALYYTFNARAAQFCVYVRASIRRATSQEHTERARVQLIKLMMVVAVQSATRAVCVCVQCGPRARARRQTRRHVFIIIGRQAIKLCPGQRARAACSVGIRVVFFPPMLLCGAGCLVSAVFLRCAIRAQSGKCKMNNIV